MWSLFARMWPMQGSYQAGWLHVHWVSCAGWKEQLTISTGGFPPLQLRQVSLSLLDYFSRMCYRSSCPHLVREILLSKSAVAFCLSADTFRLCLFEFCSSVHLYLNSYKRCVIYLCFLDAILSESEHPANKSKTSILFFEMDVALNILSQIHESSQNF